MKILHIIQRPQFRGAEIFASQLCTHLQNFGHSVILISLFEGQDDLPFKEEIVKLDRNIRFRFIDVKGWKILGEIVRGSRPDIIQANASDTLKFAVLSRLLCGWEQPIVFRNANKISDFIDSRLKYLFNKWLLGNTAHIISVSDECRLDIVNSFGLPSEKVTTGTIGISPVEIGEVPQDLEYIFSKGPVLLHVGSYVPEKNHLGLIKIFKSIKESIPQVQLVLVGTGKLFKSIESLIADKGLNDSIHILGTRSDVLEIMSGCSALLMPSLIEGMPGVILEAMYAELPVIAYDVGGIGEVIDDKVTGRLIRKGDEPSFIEATVELLLEQNLSEQYKRNGKELVLSKFRNEDIARQFEAIYKRVLETS